MHYANFATAPCSARNYQLAKREEIVRDKALPSDRGKGIVIYVDPRKSRGNVASCDLFRLAGLAELENFDAEAPFLTRRHSCLCRVGENGAKKRERYALAFVLRKIISSVVCRSRLGYHHLHRLPDRLQSQKPWKQGILRYLQGLRGRPICLRESLYR